MDKEYLANARCINVDELAELLHIGRTTAYELATSDGFPAIRINFRRTKKGRIIIPVVELEKWLQAHAGETGNDKRAE